MLPIARGKPSITAGRGARIPRASCACELRRRITLYVETPGVVIAEITDDEMDGETGDGGTGITDEEEDGWVFAQ